MSTNLSDLDMQQQGLVRRMTKTRKSLTAILEESERDQESIGAKLRLADLLAIGIGSTVGSGVFVLTGNAIPIAGPSAVISWLCAGMICLLSSLAYMELSARLPIKGSCYVFSYHCLGEAMAILGAACLTMEYGISGSGVARSWAVKIYRIINKDHWWVLCYNGQVAPSVGCNADDDFYLDPIAALITVLTMVIIILGLNMGKVVINSFTLAKVIAVIFMIVVGFSCWTGNMFESVDTFAPRGATGILSATSVLFFGFIGFDEVCCMSSKTVNPSKTMPRALAGTLLGAALMSGAAQMALAAMVPYGDDMKSTSFEEAFNDHGLQWARWIVSVAEIVLLPLVVLLSNLPQPEVTAAMSEDGLLPSVFKKQSQWNGMYIRGSILVGIFLTTVSAAVPFVMLWDMISVGVLFSFNLTNASLINVRYGNGGERKQPVVDILVWLLMVLNCGLGYTMQRGVVQPLLDGAATSVLIPTLISIGLGLAVIGVTVFIYVNFEVKCSMNDPAIFKAWGVPFLQSIAMFLNWFLIAEISLWNVIYFAMFVTVFLILCTAYMSRKRRKVFAPDAEVKKGVGDSSARRDDSYNGNADYVI